MQPQRQCEGVYWQEYKKQKNKGKGITVSGLQMIDEVRGKHTSKQKIQ